LKIQKKALETDVSALTKDRADRVSEINHLDNTINEYKQNLTDLKEAFQTNKQGYDEFINSIKEFMLQYAMFEGFIAMLQTSPAEKKSIRELASYILMLGEKIWDFYDQPDRLRYLFVTTVLGDYLKCYRCNKCGLKFIANKEPKSYVRNFSCPSCGLSWDLHADDSFLEAMLGFSSKSTDANNTEKQEN
ncbi:unnamed protein product, partial [marine sediment metagenome]